LKIGHLVVGVVIAMNSVAAVGFDQIDAVTRARYDLRLGFTVGGKVLRVHVKPGARVNKGDLLMELDDEEGQALVDLYMLRASSHLGLLSAEASLELAQVEEKAIRTAFEKDATSPIEVDRARIRTRQAQLEVNMAKQAGEEANHQLRQATERHAQYQMRAPTGGVVDLMSVEEGELVESLKPVVRLVVIDPIWVDAAVPTDQTLGLKRGDAAWVTPGLPGYDRPIKGTIIHMAQVADAASDTRLVRIEISNPKLIPAGGQVRIQFTAPTRTASTEAR